MPLLKPIRAYQINWSHPLARGLTGCWLLNEATGEKVADCGLGRNNGSFHYATTPPVWRPGKHGPALEFGTDRCIDCGTGKFGWDLTNQVSVVSLVNQSANQTNTIFARSAYVRPVRLHAQSGGRASWRVYTDGTDCLITSTSSHATNGSEWVHVAGTWRAGHGRLYVNGALEVSESSSTGSLTTTDNQFVGIGGTYGGGYLYCFDGKIEYIFVYNRVLSAEQVRWLRREPFAMFAGSISPAWIHVPSTIVSLAGLAGAASIASASLETICSLPRTERCWLRNALFNGMTANAFKLGTTLSLGWFWVRVAGCSALYRGNSMDLIDFANILTVAETNAGNISPPGYLPHNSSSTYIYIIRRFNHCGYRENTLAAAAKVSLDASGELEKPQPNKVSAVRAEQAAGSSIRLTWFYCCLEQKSPPACFNIYYDSRTGQIDYNNTLAKITYRGRKFYSYQSETLEPGKYLFALRAEDADSTENSSSAQLSVQLDPASIDPIEIVSAETV